MFHCLASQTAVELFAETVNCAAVCVILLQQCTSVLPTDSRVIARMKELVAAGVRRVPEMQRHVQSFVTDLFAGTDVPPVTDARFWPSSKAVLNCIYQATKMTRFATVHVIGDYGFSCRILSC